MMKAIMREVSRALLERHCLCVASNQYKVCASCKCPYPYVDPQFLGWKGTFEFSWQSVPTTEGCWGRSFGKPLYISSLGLLPLYCVDLVLRFIYYIYTNSRQHTLPETEIRGRLLLANFR